MMPCALIINTLADVLAELLFEVVCIFLYNFLADQGSLTHFWLILQMLFIPFINKLNEIKRIVEKYAENFKEQFRQHIGKRIDD